MVIFIHANNTRVYHDLPLVMVFAEQYLSHIFEVAVPTFLTISGYMLYRNLSKDTWLRKLKSRFFSLVIPMLIWNELGYLYMATLSSIPLFASKINTPAAFSIKDIFLQPILGDYNLVGWYLKGLIAYTLIILICYPVVKNKYIGWLPAAVALALGKHLADIKFGGNWVIHFIPFALGAYLYVCFGDKPLNKRFKPSVSVLCLCYFVLQTAALTVMDVINHIPPFPYFLNQFRLITSIICFWIGADLLTYRKPKYKFIGISFFIYCIHDFILEAIEKVFLVALGDNTLGAILDYLIAPVITLAIVIGLSYFLKRFLPKTWKLLGGGRG